VPSWRDWRKIADNFYKLLCLNGLQEENSGVFLGDKSQKKSDMAGIQHPMFTIINTCCLKYTY